MCRTLSIGFHGLTPIDIAVEFLAETILLLGKRSVIHLRLEAGS
jgi:hypothetical protein